MVPPFLWGWLIKHANLFNVYAAAQAYGFHRVYRRVLEANKRLVPEPSHRKIVQDHIKEAMRFPNRVFDTLAESHTVAFLKSYANELVNDVNSKTPPFFLSAAKLLIGKTSLGKLVSLMDDMQRSRDSKRGGKTKTS